MGRQWAAVVNRRVVEDVKTLEEQLATECRKRAVYLLSSTVQDIELEHAEPTPIDNPRFYHSLSYVRLTAGAFHQHGTLPEAGGINDQASTWVRDVLLLTATENYWIFQYRKMREEERERNKDRGY